MHGRLPRYPVFAPVAQVYKENFGVLGWLDLLHGTSTRFLATYNGRTFVQFTKGGVEVGKAATSTAADAGDSSNDSGTSPSASSGGGKRGKAAGSKKHK